MCTVPKGGTPGEQRLLPSVYILREIPRDIIAAPGSIGRVAIQVLEGHHGYFGLATVMIHPV